VTHTDHTSRTVSITAVDTSGQVHIRTWRICQHNADHIAAALGSPAQESVLTPQAAGAIAGAYETTPGVVSTHHREA
jgi:hypothetical protein